MLFLFPFSHTITTAIGLRPHFAILFFCFALSIIASTAEPLDAIAIIRFQDTYGLQRGREERGFDPVTANFLLHPQQPNLGVPGGCDRARLRPGESGRRSHRDARRDFNGVRVPSECRRGATHRATEERSLAAEKNLAESRIRAATAQLGPGACSTLRTVD